MKKKVIKLKESDLERLVQKILKESGEDRSSRYMFFSNLKQIHRQAAMLMDMDKDMLEQILEDGHDWAQDHVAEAKNNMDQVFDFIMNKIKEPANTNKHFGQINIPEDMMEEEVEADRCLRIARRKIPKSSAYRSGNIVRCRNGEIWKDEK
jgi:hypothetical protein